MGTPVPILGPVLARVFEDLPRLLLHLAREDGGDEGEDMLDMLDMLDDLGVYIFLILGLVSIFMMFFVFSSNLLMFFCHQVPRV